MDLARGTKYRSVYFVGGLAVIGFVLFCAKKYLAPPQLRQSIRFLVPQSPISLQPTRFPCLSSLASSRHTKRAAIMRGPGWMLESSIEPKCLPEREVVLSIQEGEHFLRHPVTRRIRFWITTRGEKFYVRIVESSGSERLDNSALNIVTNRKCKNESTRNCFLQSARIAAVPM